MKTWEEYEAKHESAAPPAGPFVDGGEFARRVRSLAGGILRARAHAGNVDMHTLWRYERGKLHPAITTLLRFCEAHGITPNDLLLRKDKTWKQSGRG